MPMKRMISEATNEPMPLMVRSVLYSSIVASFQQVNEVDMRSSLHLPYPVVSVDRFRQSCIGGSDGGGRWSSSREPCNESIPDARSRSARSSSMRRLLAASLRVRRILSTVRFRTLSVYETSRSIRLGVLDDGRIFRSNPIADPTAVTPPMISCHSSTSPPRYPSNPRMSVGHPRLDHAG